MSQVLVHEGEKLLFVDGLDVWNLVSSFMVHDQRIRAHLRHFLRLKAQGILVTPNVTSGYLQAALEYMLKSKVSWPI